MTSLRLFVATLLIGSMTAADAFTFPRRAVTWNLPMQSDCSVIAATSSLSSSLTPDDAQRTIIEDMLLHMTSFFVDMVDDVDDGHSRFYYRCIPPTGERHHHHMPVRDLAAAWDATKALTFLQNHQLSGNTRSNSHDDEVMRQRLTSAVHGTLQAYNQSHFFVGDGDTLALDPDILQETPNIAHSALMIMASAGAQRVSIFQDGERLSIDGLVRGILSMQRPSDGAFRIEFGDNCSATGDVYRGIDFFPGEAMLALMDAYHLSEQYDGILDTSTRDAIVPSMERAFVFYCDYYHQRNADVNYNIWQIQAYAKFFDILDRTGRSEHARLLATHILCMCQDVINSKAWKYELSRGCSFYTNLNTVEIVCGLDALADGIRIALAIDDGQMAALLQRNARNAICFIQWMQDQVPFNSPAGYGGLGYGGVRVLEQRLDVTGHAISALTKLLR